MALRVELQEKFGDKFIFETASNPIEAFDTIEMLKNEGINVLLIITDWLMPKMKGDEFLIKVKEKYPDIKFIVISGQMDENAIKKLESDAEPLAIIKKPWNPEKLYNLIESLI